MSTRSWRQVTPYRIEIRAGGGVLSVFGLPFLAVGIFMCLAVTGVVTMRGTDDAAARVALPLMALAFTSVGGGLVFGRIWTSIDRAEGTFERQWGLLVPWNGRTTRLADCVAVAIGFTRGDSDSAEQFPVTLKSRTDPDRKIFSARTYTEARECATAVARLLDVDVRDATTDHAVSVPAGRSELSLPERLRLDGGADEPAVPRPAILRSDVRSEGDGVRITIPMPPVHPFMIAAMLVPAVFIAVLVAPFSALFDRTRTPDPIGLTFFGVFALMFVGIPVVTVLGAVLRSRWGATIVTASREGVRIDTRGAWRTTTGATYAAADIFDVDYSTTESTLASVRQTAAKRAYTAGGTARPAISPGLERVLSSIVTFARSAGITLKTRQGLARFGAGLPDGEIRYVHALVRGALTGTARF